MSKKDTPKKDVNSMIRWEKKEHRALLAEAAEKGHTFAGYIRYLVKTHPDRK